MKVIFENIKIVDPLSNANGDNILIVDGVISKIGKLEKGDYDGSKVFDLNGAIVTPGFFDMHVHFREPGREDEETVQTGSNSAAAGGFTGVACMPNTDPAIDSAEVVRFIQQKAAGHLVDVYPIGAATQGRKGEAISPMAELSEAGVVAFSDDGVAIKTASVLRSAMEYSAMFNKVIIEHCEDETLADGAMNESEMSTKLGLPPLPAVSEDLIVSRDLLMAEYLGASVHIAHISTKGAVDLVRKAKERGIKVTAEVTPHHFSLTDEALISFNPNYKMNPPLRTQEDVEACIEGLKDGTIDCIATDHAPHAIEEKELEFIYAPNGIVGLETAIGVTLNELYHKKHLTLEQIVEKMAINPRKILNLDIPSVKQGEKANLTIFNLDEVWTVDITKFKSKSKNSPFDKMILTGKQVASVNNSKLYIDGEFMNI